MFVIRVAYPGGHSVWLTRRFPSAAWGLEKDALSGRRRRQPCLLRLLHCRRDRLRRGLKALGASGQLGYGIPEKSRAAGARAYPRLHRRGYGVDRPRAY